MHRSLSPWIFLALAVACKPTDPPPPGKPAATSGGSATNPTEPATPAATPTIEQSAFRDAAVDPPKDYSGPRFKLSADYPDAQPTVTPANSPWLSLNVDFGDGTKAPDFVKGGWAAYMQALLDYIKLGQDPDLADSVGFRTDVDGRTRWYHIPWMAFDPRAGREFVHGCTNERTAHLSDLVEPGQHSLPAPNIDPKCEALNKAGFESWSVGFYNDFGGWAVGRAFPRRGDGAGAPQTATDPQGRTTMKGLPFPTGTVVTKVLTTTATAECVPALRGAPAWTVDRHRYDEQAAKYLCERALATTHVLQIDVAVVDERSPIRWVYGTFVYDGSLPGATFWDRLQPLGVQWGSDPGAWPAVQPADSKPVVQSALNAAVKTYQHEGCNGRLAGPVDNPQSSCVSCHAAGFAVAPAGTPVNQGFTTATPPGNVPPIFGFAGLCPLPDTTVLSPDLQPKNHDYFGNYAYPAAYPGYTDLISMDTSLQLQVAMQQYAVYKTQDGRPAPCAMK